MPDSSPEGVRSIGPTSGSGGLFEPGGVLRRSGGASAARSESGLSGFRPVPAVVWLGDRCLGECVLASSAGPCRNSR